MTIIGDNLTIAINGTTPFSWNINNSYGGSYNAGTVDLYYLKSLQLSIYPSHSTPWARAKDHCIVLNTEAYVPFSERSVRNSGLTTDGTQPYNITVRDPVDSDLFVSLGSKFEWSQLVTNIFFSKTVQTMTVEHKGGNIYEIHIPD